MGAVKNHFHDEIADRGKDPADYVSVTLTETSPNHWNDNFNDVFVDLRRGSWVVSIRGHGNRIVIIGDYLERENAFATAQLIAGDRELFHRLAA
jgi:hypothetical protein